MELRQDFGSEAWTPARCPAGLVPCSLCTRTVPCASLRQCQDCKGVCCAACCSGAYETLGGGGDQEALCRDCMGAAWCEDAMPCSSHGGTPDTVEAGPTPAMGSVERACREAALHCSSFGARRSLSGDGGGVGSGSSDGSAGHDWGQGAPFGRLSSSDGSVGWDGTAAGAAAGSGFAIQRRWGGAGAWSQQGPADTTGLPFGWCA